MVELKSYLVGYVRKSKDKVLLLSISKEALKKVKTTKTGVGEFFKLSVNLEKTKEIIAGQREVTAIVAEGVKRNPLIEYYKIKTRGR